MKFLQTYFGTKNASIKFEKNYVWKNALTQFQFEQKKSKMLKLLVVRSSKDEQQRENYERIHFLKIFSLIKIERL